MANRFLLMEIVNISISLMDTAPDSGTIFILFKTHKHEQGINYANRNAGPDL